MSTPTSLGAVSAITPTGDVTIDSLLDTYKWGGAAGTGVALEYSFQNPSSAWSSDGITGYGTPLTNPSGEPWNPATPLTAGQLDAFRAALGAWAEVANITFAEVTDGPAVAGDLRFGTTSDAGTEFAHAYLPAPTAYAGDVWFLGGDPVLEDTTPGGYGYLTTLHEIGHALGLKHPHERDHGFPKAPADIDSKQYTVMSYRDYAGQDLTAPSESDFYPTTPMLDDVRAIQHLYGANLATRSGDTLYTWSPGAQLYETLWDGGGDDTIDWSNQSSAALIDLHDGAFSRLGPPVSTGPSSPAITGTLAIAWGATIENAVGGAGDDTLIGNGAPNQLAGGPGDDRYSIDSTRDVVVENAGEGSDTVFSAASHDLEPNVEALVLTGGAGLSATGNALDNAIVGNPGANSLIGGDGNDTLTGLGGDDTLIGGIDNDVMFGGDGADSLTGDEADDLLQGNAGLDTLRGGLGNDDERGGQDDDFVFGGQGTDTLTGAFGNDELHGGLDNDVETAGQGNDTLFGGQNDDTLQGRAGNDSLIGGLGNDIFWFNAAGAATADVIYDFTPGEDRIELDSSALSSLVGMAGGSPAAGNFLAGVAPVPENTNQLLLYDTSTGDLYYDPDGSGAASAELIATLANHAGVIAGDIFVS